MVTRQTWETDSHRSHAWIDYENGSRAQSSSSLKKLSEFLFISRVYKLTLGIFLAELSRAWIHKPRYFQCLLHFTLNTFNRSRPSWGVLSESRALVRPVLRSSWKQVYKKQSHPAFVWFSQLAICLRNEKRVGVLDKRSFVNWAF